MEGKQEERASPLDFPSADYERARRTRLDNERLAGQAISPPTIPRSTSDVDTRTVFRGWQSSGIQSHGLSPSRSTGSYPSSILGETSISSTSNFTSTSRTLAASTGSSFSRPAPTSAFSSSRPRKGRVYGQIPAYGEEGNQEIFCHPVEQQGIPAASSSSSWGYSVEAEDRPQYFAPRAYVAAPASQGRFFTPLPAAAISSLDQLDHETTRSIDEDAEGHFTSPRRDFRLHAAASIQTMGSIEECVPLPRPIESTQARGGRDSLFGPGKSSISAISTIGASSSVESESISTRRGQSGISYGRFTPTHYRRGTARSGRSEARSLSSGRSRVSENLYSFFMNETLHFIDLSWPNNFLIQS